MLAVRLPESIEKRLEELARRTGHTKTFYAREALLQHLEEMEDRFLAEQSLGRIQRGESQTSTLAQVKKRLGLKN